MLNINSSIATKGHLIENTWKDVESKTTLLPAGHTIGKGELLFSKIEPEQIQAQLDKLQASKKMNEAAKELLTHTNFKCFSKSMTDIKTFDCNVTEAYWELNENMLVFHITANRFLRNMVRAIVGTLVDIGLNKTSLEAFKKIMESENRSEAGFSVPARGLFLTKIVYPKSIIKNE